MKAQGGGGWSGPGVLRGPWDGPESERGKDFWSSLLDFSSVPTNFFLSLRLCLSLSVALCLFSVSPFNLCFCISVSVCGKLALSLLLFIFHTFVTRFVAQCHRLCFFFSPHSVSARLGSQLHLPEPSLLVGKLRTLPTLAQAPLGFRQPQVFSRHLCLLSHQPGPPLRPGGVPSGATAPGGLGPAWN